ncbi:hypothetical protein E1B28_011953 [Marasmius oreades]|uniref:Uncharacterized protein n=1 Tax=Marasmius oreades TaxID=181124 RepID=A0A9P7RRF4_9AGAR|nr:uncharacterized protein E1B28_011953 [Marasmius oreades]KAG7087906.1 hypothetical protein E1B28_011953 [Marasmius oreades]
MENVANTFRRSLARPKPTIIIPPLPNPFTRTLTPPTTSPPLTPVTPSTPTPTAEFPSGTFRSLNTPKASHVSHNPFEFPEGEEIISVSTHPCEPKDDLGLLTPPLTPPSIQLANLPDCLCPIARCDSRSFGICVGAPVKDILAGSSRSLTGSSRKRKREEQEQWCSSASGNDHETSDQHIIPAHAPKVAPCNDCLDDDESLLWGRCDNKGCWSRCYEPKRNKSKNSKKHSSNADQQVRASPEIALICPDCSPEGAL